MTSFIFVVVVHGNGAQARQWIVIPTWTSDGRKIFTLLTLGRGNTEHAQGRCGCIASTMQASSMPESRQDPGKRYEFLQTGPRDAVLMLSPSILWFLSPCCLILSTLFYGQRVEIYCLWCALLWPTGGDLLLVVWQPVISLEKMSLQKLGQFVETILGALLLRNSSPRWKLCFVVQRNGRRLPKQI